jgi:hypothetical protein
MKPHRFAIPFALILLAVAPSVRATQVVHLDTRALVRESSDIVIGQVEDASAHWNENHSAIVTEVTLSISQTLKGAAAERLTLRQMGGEVDGLRYTIEGSPSFAIGEEALLFVWRDAAGRPQVDGLAQGKFEIAKDPATGERLVQRSLPGLAIRDAKTLSMAPAGGKASRIPLNSLVREIQTALGEAGR